MLKLWVSRAGFLHSLIHWKHTVVCKTHRTYSWRYPHCRGRHLLIHGYFTLKKCIKLHLWITTLFLWFRSPNHYYLGCRYIHLFCFGSIAQTVPPPPGQPPTHRCTRGSPLLRRKRNTTATDLNTCSSRSSPTLPNLWSLIIVASYSVRSTSKLEKSTRIV